jgi:3'-5' exoribonuclease
MSIDYRYWGDRNEAKVKEMYESIADDTVVFVQARADAYKGRVQLSTNPPDTIKVLKEGEFDPNMFIQPPRRPIDEMVAELRAFIQSMENPEIKRLLNHIFLEDEKFLGTFKSHPGAIEIHHNWKGGLLQHTLEVARFVELGKELFPELDRDVAIAGALLHDIGKTKEIEATTRIKGTREGQLKGHIPMGFKMVSNAMDSLGTSEDVKDRLLHIVLSHHGSNNFGSPKEPMFIEAVAVYYADELSAKIAEMLEFTNFSREVTKDDFMYSKRLNRNILLR